MNRGAKWRNHYTDEQKAEAKARFLEALRDGNSPTYAAQRTDICRRTFYVWRKSDEEFDKAWEEAMDQGTDVLEDVAVQRAKDGSDTLLIFMLKARRKAVYGDCYSVRHGGYDGGSIKYEDVSGDRPTLDVLFAEFIAERDAETKH